MKLEVALRLFTLDEVAVGKRSIDVNWDEHWRRIETKAKTSSSTGDAPVVTDDGCVQRMFSRQSPSGRAITNNGSLRWEGMDSATLVMRTG